MPAAPPRWQQTGHVAAEDARELLGESFPDYDWQSARHLHGAFHDVWVVDEKVVARVTRSSYTAARLRQRIAVVELVAQLGLPVRTPRPLSEVVRWDERRAAVLIEWMDGAECDDNSFAGNEYVERVGATLNALHRAPTELLQPSLLPVRDWCGGEQWPELVRELLPRLPPEHRGRAVAAVGGVLGLDEVLVLAHGDLTRFNFLWGASSVPALIDWDHACLAGASLDVACLLGSLGASRLIDLVGGDIVAGAVVQKRSFPLQVAAAGWLNDDDRLCDAGLRNFADRPDPVWPANL